MASKVQRRQITIQVEKIEKFTPLTQSSTAYDFESLADMVDVLVVNLTEAGRSDELGNGSMYAILQKKLTEQMLIEYFRWLQENDAIQSVVTLKEGLMREAEFKVEGTEAVNGLCQPKEPQQRALFTTSMESREDSHVASDFRAEEVCSFCNGRHSVEMCVSFHHKTVSERWQSARESNLCFRCLQSGHQGIACHRTRVCSKDGCCKTHHPLLHSATKDMAKEATNK